MTISICLVTYALDVTELVTALAGDDVIWNVYQHSRNRQVITSCQSLEANIPNFIYHDYRENRGLSRSWNDGLIAGYAQGADCVVLLNDDMTASRADLDQLVDYALAHPAAGVIKVEGTQGGNPLDMNYGFAVINRVATDVVGFFDQNYSPIYGEDSDYSRRCGILGVTFESAGKTGVVHASSATIKSDSALNAQNRITFERNRDYHKLKHGGDYSSETYMHPFNDPSLSWKIGAENRRNPYPNHQRTDLGLIKI